MEECRLPRALSSLDVLFKCIDGFSTRQSLSSTTAYELRLAIEELFTNLMKYHPESSEAVLLRLEREGPRIRVTLQDFDVDPWDVAAPPPRDVEASPDLEAPGGRGMNLIRQVTDDLRYDYRDRVSTITFTKRVDA